MTDPSTPDGRAPIEPSAIDDLGYNEALLELEAVLGRLESTAVDVDELGQQVRRAALLIEHCRRRLRVVEQDVAGVLAQLGQLAADADSDGSDAS